MVLLLALGVFVYMSKKKAAAPLQAVKTSAESGKVVAGFPTDLALKSSAVEDSYKISYPGVDQYTDIFNTQFKTVKDAYDAYLKYLPTQNYVIVNKELQTNYATIYAASPAQRKEVNVAITLDGGKINVITSYLQK